jgi:hypothetical protein
MSLGIVLRHLRKGDWQGAHVLVQKDETALGCWAHGIVHVLEGDVDNARYWYRRARRAWPDRYDVPAELAALAAECEATQATAKDER